MAWNDTQTESDEITHTEWNDMVTCILNISGVTYDTSSNKGLYYPSSLGKQVSSQVNVTSLDIITLYALSTNAVGLYYPSSLGKQVSSQVDILTLHSSNSNIHFTVESIIDDFYPSTNGKALSGATSPVVSWYVASSMKLSESGSKLSEWYYYSSSKLSESGQKYSDLYSWYGVSISSQQYPNWLISGEKLSRWYVESSAKISEISGALSSRINLKQNSLDGSEYYPSSLGKQVSSQVTKAYASAQIAQYDAGLTQSQADLTYLKLEQGTKQYVVNGVPSFYDLKISGMSLNNSTYSSMRDFMNSFASPGRKTGGDIWDKGSSKITVSGGTGFLKASDDDNAPLYFIDFPTSTDNTIPADTVRYIGVEWNSGTPQVSIRTSYNWNYDSDFPLGRVVNETINGAESLHIIQNPWWVTDSVTNTIERFNAISGRVIRDANVGGLIISVPGTRNLAVTAGTLWSNLNEFPVSAIDTSVTGEFEYYWYKAGSGWQESDATAYSVTQWNDVTQTTLQSLGVNKYANVWVFAEADDQEIAVLYPQAQYNTAAEAEATQIPSNIPTHIQNNGILVGRIIIRQGTDTPVKIQTAFGTSFTNSVTTSHSNLSNLSADDHTQYFNDTRIQPISSMALSGAIIGASGSKYTEWYRSSNAISMWYYYSSSKLSESGQKLGDLYSWYAFGTSSQQFSNWLVSGEKLSRWYTESSSKISIYVDSGNEYSDLYVWYGPSISSNQYSNWLQSGNKLSTFFKESAQKLGELASSGSNWWDSWKWYNTSSNQFSNWLSSGEKLSRYYYESSQKVSILVASGSSYSDLYTWYQPSTAQYTNWLASGEKLSRWYSESSSKISDVSSQVGILTLHSSNANIHYTVETILDDFYPSSLGKQVSGQVEILTLHSSNTNIHFTLESILDDFYPSSVGKALSGATAPIITWYLESSAKLNSGSGWNKAWASAQVAKYDSVGGVTDHGDLTGLTDDDHPLYYEATRIQQISSMAFSGAVIGSSGSKYTDAYQWYNTYNSQLNNWLDSGEKLSRWYYESSSTLNSGQGWNKAWASAQIAAYDAVAADWSTLAINSDKDWNSYNNYDIGSISSSTISGQWTIPTVPGGKPPASATWLNRMVVASGTNASAGGYLWVCLKTSTPGTYQWRLIDYTG